MKRSWSAAMLVVICAACGPSSGPSAQPGSSASPTPVASLLTAGNETALIYFRDAANPKQIDGMTWKGLVGKASGIGDYHRANPSETLFGTATEIRNRQGDVIGPGDFGVKSWTATWADDDVHYCLMKPFDFLGANGVPATLYEGSVEGGMSAIAQVGTVYEQGSLYVASCSFVADRAVVVQSGGQGVGVAQYWMVQVSTGRILWTHRFGSGNAPTSIVVSHDSRYIAENFASPSGAQTSTIYAGDGSRVTELSASVSAFSWNDSTVVLFSPQPDRRAYLARLDSGRVIWSSPTGLSGYIWNVMAEPNGQSLAVGLANPAAPAASWIEGYPPVDLYVIDATGGVLKELRGVHW